MMAASPKLLEKMTPTAMLFNTLFKNALTRLDVWMKPLYDVLNKLSLTRLSQTEGDS
jgi:hypothetical protein